MGCAWENTALLPPGLISSPRPPAGAVGSPSPAPSLPSLTSPSRQDNSLPIPSSGPCRGGKEVVRGFLAPAPDPPFSVLCSRAFTPPGLSHLRSPKPLRLQVPQPRSIAARGTRLLSPKNPWMRGLVPPDPVPCHPTGPPLPQFCLVLRALFFWGGGDIPGSGGSAPTSPCVAWVYSLHFPRVRGPRCPAPAQVLGCYAGVCRLTRCSPDLPLAGDAAPPGWRPGSGLGRWRVVLGLRHLQPFLYKLIKENIVEKKKKQLGWG